MLGTIGAAPGGTGEQRLQKTLLVASTTMMASLAVLWGGLYAVYDELLAASIPLSYAATSLVSLTLFRASRDTDAALPLRSQRRNRATNRRKADIVLRPTSHH